MDRETALRILGLSDMNFTPEQLRSAYRKAAKKAHPDLGGSEKAFCRVTEAHKFLLNPTSVSETGTKMKNNTRMSVTHQSILDIVCC